MYTRIAKGLVVTLTVLVFIGAIVAIVATGEFLLGLGILIIGLVSLLVLGVMVELANNVLDIKECLMRQNTRPDYSASQPAMQHGYYSNGTHISNNGAGYNLMAGAENIQGNSYSGSWLCSQCGTRNKRLDTFCSGCGAYK